MTDRNWLILAVPGWFFGAVFIALLWNVWGDWRFGPILLQTCSIGLIWGVILPITVWRER